MRGPAPVQTPEELHKLPLLWVGRAAARQCCRQHGAWWLLLPQGNGAGSSCCSSKTLLGEEPGHSSYKEAQLGFVSSQAWPWCEHARM